mmetsp:Transcript_11249/g.23013  ORF Transcript_11249/g.23013 Transcript_11249/m.23013 type:complete len:307 (+) Transcript_11249:978-1898(+)
MNRVHSVIECPAPVGRRARRPSIGSSQRFPYGGQASYHESHSVANKENAVCWATSSCARHCNVRDHFRLFRMEMFAGGDLRFTAVTVIVLVPSPKVAEFWSPSNLTKLFPSPNSTLDSSPVTVMSFLNPSFAATSFIFPVTVISLNPSPSVAEFWLPLKEIILSPSPKTTSVSFPVTVTSFHPSPAPTPFIFPERTKIKLSPSPKAARFSSPVINRRTGLKLALTCAMSLSAAITFSFPVMSTISAPSKLLTRLPFPKSLRSSSKSVPSKTLLSPKKSSVFPVCADTPPLMLAIQRNIKMPWYGTW